MDGDGDGRQGGSGGGGVEANGGVCANTGDGAWNLGEDVRSLGDASWPFGTVGDGGF